MGTRPMRSEIQKQRGEEAGGDPFVEATHGGDALVVPPGTAPLTQAQVIAPFVPPVRPVAKAAKRYRVTEVPRSSDGQALMVSVGKFKARLFVGKELDEREYDVQKLGQQGVKFEEIAGA